MERAGERVLHFEIGRPDFDTPEYIKRAANEAMAQGKVHYTSNFGMMELRQAIADIVPAAFPPAVRWRLALRRITTPSQSHCRNRGTLSPYPPARCRGTMRKGRDAGTQ